MTLLLWLSIPFAGLLLGLFGAGGGIIMVPLLLYGAGFPIKVAIATSLWVVAIASLVTVVQQRAWRVIRPKLLFFFATGGLLGSWLGAWIGSWIAEWIQQSLFGLTALLVALWMWRSAPPETSPEQKECRCLLATLVGLGMGVMTGLLGVGGGFLIMPALIYLGISTMSVAVLHSLMLVSLNSTVAGTFYLFEVPLPLFDTFGIATLAALGAVTGFYLLKRIPQQHSQGLFSVLLLAMGFFMLSHVFFEKLG